MANSNIHYLDIKEILNEHLPIRISYNSKIIYDDDGETPFQNTKILLALEEENPIISEYSVRFVHSHHSYIEIWGDEIKCGA